MAKSKNATVGGFIHDKEDDDYTSILWKSYRWYDVSDYPLDYDAEMILDGVSLADPFGGNDVDETIRFFKELPKNANAAPFPEPYNSDWDKNLD